jgi:hypothetical protein
MDHSAGLDVSVKETSVCIVDDTGRIVREVKVASEPEALLAVLKNPAYRFKRIGLEAGPLSQWLFSALAEAELPVICVETSLYGDSVGRYEGDTLVVDTVGIRTDRPFAMVDMYGTPYTSALHVVERYRLLDYDAAKEGLGPVLNYQF